MLTLCIFVLVVFGVTNIISGSKLFRPIRDLLFYWNGNRYTFLNCYMCMGFWVGCFISLSDLCLCSQLHFVQFGYYPQGIKFVFSMIFDGFIGSGSTWIIHVVLEKLGAGKL